MAKKKLNTEPPLPKPSADAVQAWRGNQYAAQFWGADWASSGYLLTRFRQDWAVFDPRFIRSLSGAYCERARRMINEFYDNRQDVMWVQTLFDVEPLKEGYGFELTFKGCRLLLHAWTAKKHGDPFEDNFERLQPEDVVDLVLYQSVEEGWPWEKSHDPAHPHRSFPGPGPCWPLWEKYRGPALPWPPSPGPV